jgi:hypothetical protein
MRPVPPSDPALLADLRTRAEAVGDLAGLLHWRGLERVAAQTPPLINGFRRRDLIAEDPISTTWSATAQEDGRPALLRLLRPEWRDDPAMLRHFHPDPGTPARFSPGPWPHLSLSPPGPPLASQLGAAHDPSSFAQLTGSLLQALLPHHRQGRALGHPLAERLFFGPHGWVAASLGDFRLQSLAPATDIATLAALLTPWAPRPDSSLASLLAGWTDSPPPEAGSAIQLFRSSLSADLLEARHRLAVCARNRRARSRRAGLRSMLLRLQAACPPPPGRYCLHAAWDGLLVLAEVHEDGVFGGQADERTNPKGLPLVWNATAGLLPAPARLLLRSWSTRLRGDESRRAEVQAAIDPRASPLALARWLSATSRLRVAWLLG